MDPKQYLDKLQVPPELEKPYNQVVLAGMKVMFDQQTHQMMLDQLGQQGPLEQRIGEGVATLMAILFNRSNQTMPPQVLIPAGINLVLQAIDFVQQTGMEPVDDTTVANSIEVFIQALLQKFNTSLDEVMQILNAAAQQGQNAPANVAPPVGA